jgi:hypothetical protein
MHLLLRVVSGVLAVMLVSLARLACAQADPYNLSLRVQQIEDRKFATIASFKLPLKHCQAWRYLIDYDSSASIPGVLSSKTSRLNNNKAQVTLVMEEQILFFKIRMNSVINFVELKNQGTDFVQIAGEAKSFHGTWRIEPFENETLFKYQSTFQPDSALPMVVIKYFFERRLRNSFEAIAQIGASHKDIVCD